MLRRYRSDPSHVMPVEEIDLNMDLSYDEKLVEILASGSKVLCGCKEAVLGLHHMRQKNHLHFKECMIQGLCESSMPAKKRFSRRLKDHEGIKRIRIFSNIPKGRVYQQRFRNKVKVKDLKPKRIKDYFECKISQRSHALLKYLLFNDF
ncbi:hypothetical protein GQ457_07G006500 [Hibiscus cannabinus]